MNYSDVASRLARISGVVLALSCLGILLVFLALSLYTHPSDIDDLCIANEFKTYGILGGSYRQYLIWNGVYTTTLITGAVPKLFDFLAIYKFLPVALFLVTVFAVARCTRAICRLQGFAVWPYLVGVGFTVIFLATMQSVVMGFYWFNGAVTYTLSSAILAGMIALIIRILDGDGGEALQSRRFIYLGLLVVIGMGMAETVMVEMFVLLNGVCLWQIFLVRERRRKWSVLLGLTYLGFLVVALAPGNQGRSAHILAIYPDHRAGIQFWDSLLASIYYGHIELLRLLTLPHLWWSTLIMVILFSRYAQRLGSFRKIRSFHVLLGGAACVFVPIVLQFPWQLMHSGPTHIRTQNAITFGFLLSWYCTWAMITFRYWSYRKPVLCIQPPRVYSRVVFTAACLALSAGLPGKSNITQAYSDLVSSAYAYDQYMQQRYAKLEEAAARGDQSVTLKLYADSPPTISLNEVNGNYVGTNVRTCLGLYFGFESMNVE